jgi:hypothetical protein
VDRIQSSVIRRRMQPLGKSACNLTLRCFIFSFLLGAPLGSFFFGHFHPPMARIYIASRILIVKYVYNVHLSYKWCVQNPLHTRDTSSTHTRLFIPSISKRDSAVGPKWLYFDCGGGGSAMSILRGDRSSGGEWGTWRWCLGGN